MRVVLLWLATAGALAVLLAIIFAVGLARMRQEGAQFASARPPTADANPVPKVERSLAGARQAASQPLDSNDTKPKPPASLIIAPPAPAGRPVVAPAQRPIVAPKASSPIPQAVAVAPGEIVLAAADAKRDGPGFRLTGQGTIGWWDDPSARACWQVQVPEAAAFEVQVVYSCGSDGREFEVDAAGKTVGGRSHNTGGWDAFQTQTVGAMTLPAGESVISIHPIGAGGALMNLRALRLRPGAGAASAPQSTPVLAADAASIHGATLRLEGDQDRYLAFWTTPGEYPQWVVHVPRPGRYQVKLRWGNDPGTGGPFRITVGERTLDGVTRSTGSFWRFDTMPVGEVELAAGHVTLDVKDRGPFAVALMNLRSVELVSPPGAAAAGRLLIRNAAYFDPSGTARVDVTQRVRAAVKNNALSFEVDNGTLGGDPAPGVVKKLRVDYTLDGQERSKTVDEHERFTLSPAED